MQRKYSEDELTKAILMILDGSMTPKQVAEATGINLRAIQRYKSKYLEPEKREKAETEVVFKGETTIPTPKVQEKLEKTMIERAKFLDDVFETKQVLLKQINKVAKRSENLDAMQRTLKTLTDIEQVVLPADDDVPAAHAKTVNIFQLFNQNLIKDGYKGPELTDADIIKND